jgi:hypothetical protein
MTNDDDDDDEEDERKHLFRARPSLSTCFVSHTYIHTYIYIYLDSREGRGV